MKKTGRVWFVVVLTAVSSLGGFLDSALAHEQARHQRLLVDPIKTEDGYVAGTVVGDPGNPVRAYRGIPYAAPPVGALRWMPPQPAARWSGIRESTAYSVHPVQWVPGRYYPVGEPESEDCLYLNVLTPARHAGEKLPVIVWFHGGALAGASGNDITWNHHRLPQRGIVLVTVNTRLGALGLLAHPSLTAEQGGHSGNYMYLDMIASLKWVQRNVAAFGGNPRNVTVFGQSGGGWKVTGLLASPLGKDLFHKAIIQSGAGLAPVSLKEAETWGEQYLAKLGVSTLEEARALPWHKLVDAYVAMKIPPGPAFGVAVDGYFLPDTPLNIFESGRQNAVPMILQAVTGELAPPPLIPGMIPYYVKLFTANSQRGIKGYASIFNQVPANWKAEGIKSFHSVDLPYTFGFYDDPDADMWKQMTKRVKPPLRPELGKADKMVSEAMLSMWAQFAKTGAPNVKGKEGAIHWPAWNPSEDEYLYMEEGLRIKSGFSTVGQ